MASVWIARQRGKHGFEKLVAIKTILPQYAADLRFQQMFLDEARIASRIEHFNVARILDLGEEHDVLYLAMEYVDGDSLSKLNRACAEAGHARPGGRRPAHPGRRLLGPARGARAARRRRQAARHRPPRRQPAQHPGQHQGRREAHRLRHRQGARPRSATRRTPACSRARSSTWRPSRRSAGRSTGARTSGPSARCSTTCSRASPPYEADNTLGTLHLLTSGRPPLPLPPSVHRAVAAIARKALDDAARAALRDRRRDARRHGSGDGRREGARPRRRTSPPASSASSSRSGRRSAGRSSTSRWPRRPSASASRRSSGRPSTGRDSGVTSAPSVRTAADAPGALRSEAPPSFRPSDRPTTIEQPSSGGPPSSDQAPSVERSPSLELLVPRSRAPLVVSFLVGGALVAGGVAFATMRSHASPATQAVSVVAAATAPPVATAAANPTGAPSAASSATGDIPNLLGRLPAQGRGESRGSSGACRRTRPRPPGDRRPSPSSGPTARRDGDDAPCPSQVGRRRVLAHIPCRTSIDGGRSAVAGRHERRGEAED